MFERKIAEAAGPIHRTQRRPVKKFGATLNLAERAQETSEKLQWTSLKSTKLGTVSFDFRPTDQHQLALKVIYVHNLF